MSSYEPTEDVDNNSFRQRESGKGAFFISEIDSSFVLELCQQQIMMNGDQIVGME